MKSSVFSSCFVILVVTITTFLNSEKRTWPKTWPLEGPNYSHFERLLCWTYPGSKVSHVRCRVKYIDRNNLKADMFANLSKPVNDMWIHGVIYYKYNTYQKIATEYWDNPCDWLAGKRMSFLLDFVKPYLFKYSNCNHTCPYDGALIARTDNLSAQALSFPQIVPAGRYRLDFNVTEGDRTTLLAGGSLYTSVSDHRVDIL